MTTHASPASAANRLQDIGCNKPWPRSRQMPSARWCQAPWPAAATAPRGTSPCWCSPAPRLAGPGHAPAVPEPTGWLSCQYGAQMGTPIPPAVSRWPGNTARAGQVAKRNPATTW